MRFVFRADSSNTIGAGHVMRLCAIAQEAIEYGIECIFVGEITDVPWLAHHVHRVGFSEILTPVDFTSKVGEDVLILDTYNLENYSFITSKIWSNTVLIADQVTPSFDVDLIVHPGFNGNWFTGDDTKFVYGPEYIPIRKSPFRGKRISMDFVSRIVIVGGGTDVFRLCPKIAHLLKTIPEFSSAVFFSPEKDLIENIDQRFSVRDFGEDLDQELEFADLVITTASTTSFEILAKGIPVGIVSVAENQIDNYESFARLEIAAVLGKRGADNSWDINSSLLTKLITQGTFRSELVSRASKLIDSDGAQRIVKEMASRFNF